MGTPNYPKDMGTEWQKLKREVKGAFTSGNLRKGFQQLSAGILDVFGKLVIHPGGSLVSQYTTGTTALLIGTHFLSGGGGQVEGVIIRRPSGSLVFWTYGQGGSDSFWALYDKGGRIIFSDDAASGKGIATPWLPYNVVRSLEIVTPPDTTQSSTYQSFYTITGWMQHPKIVVKAKSINAGSATSQVRIKDSVTGTVIAETATLAAGSHDIELTGDHVNWEFGKYFKYDVEYRRVSGGVSEDVFGIVLAVSGRQT